MPTGGIRAISMLFRVMPRSEPVAGERCQCQYVGSLAARGCTDGGRKGGGGGGGIVYGPALDV